MPTSLQILQNLNGVANGKQVWRDKNQPLAHPSIYSREVCRLLHEKLQQNSWDHPLPLLGCILNPVFREIEFIQDTVRRMDYRSKAEEFARSGPQAKRENLNVQFVGKRD